MRPAAFLQEPSAPRSPASFDWTGSATCGARVRNSVGVASIDAESIYGVVHGLDNVHILGNAVHQAQPAEMVVLLEKDRNFGYPYCMAAQRLIAADGSVIAPGTVVKNEDFTSAHDDAWCATNATRPVTFLQAHSAPLSIAFFD